MSQRRRQLLVLLSFWGFGAAAMAEPKPPVPTSTVGEKDDRLSSTEEINLSVGEHLTIPATDVKNYSEGLRGIAEIRLTPDNTQFVIVGQKPGATTLLLIKKDGSEHVCDINVFARPLKAVERELLQLLDDTKGVRIRRVGARFFLEGSVPNESELHRVQQIALLFPGQVESLVVVGEAVRAQDVNIRVDFFFVQYDRNKTFQFGVNWPATIGGRGVASGTAEYDLLANALTSAQASVVNQPLPGLDIAATNGWAKVLKHSTVVTSNGTEAAFSSGGEQNYSITSGLTAALSQVKFGTDVTVLPRFDAQTRKLEVKLLAEVADLTPPVAQGTLLPGRNVSRLSTFVVLKLGQSIVLSGIRTRAQRHDVKGIPGLSEIPLIGILFGSHSDDQQDVEGAIYVVPSIIDALPKSVEETLAEALKQYEGYSGDLSDVEVWTEPRNGKTRKPAGRKKP